MHPIISKPYDDFYHQIKNLGNEMEFQIRDSEFKNNRFCFYKNYP